MISPGLKIHPWGPCATQRLCSGYGGPSGIADGVDVSVGCAGGCSGGGVCAGDGGGAGVYDGDKPVGSLATLGMEHEVLVFLGLCLRCAGQLHAQTCLSSSSRGIAFVCGVGVALGNGRGGSSRCASLCLLVLLLWAA